MNAVIAQIVLEGLKTWNQERRLAFKRKHAKVLRAVEVAAGKIHPDYNDAELNIAKREKRIFMQAFLTEMVAHNKEAGNEKNT